MNIQLIPIMKTFVSNLSLPIIKQGNTQPSSQLELKAFKIRAKRLPSLISINEGTWCIFDMVPTCLVTGVKFSYTIVSSFEVE